MGSFPKRLAADLRDRLGLKRAIETGTFDGGTAKMLGEMFEEVVTIERSDVYYERARELLAPVPNVRQIHGHSGEQIGALAPNGAPTLYWLDAHWSGGDTAGSDDPVPLVRELDGIGAGDPRDCILIDDAREFAAPPEPRWPQLVEVIDKLRAHRPDAYVTVIHDLIISVPHDARDVVDTFARAHAWTVHEAGERARGVEPPSKLATAANRLRAGVGRRLGR